MIKPGSIHGPEGAIRVGVPFGSRARLILLYLQSEAIRTDSREIELGRSLRVWLGKLGLPTGGKSMKDVRDQALRLSRCRNGALLETVELSESFFNELKRHPVPLQEE